VPYCQKYTPTYCFFGDFAHWDRANHHILIYWLVRDIKFIECRWRKT